MRAPLEPPGWADVFEAEEELRLPEGWASEAVVLRDFNVKCP